MNETSKGREIINVVVLLVLGAWIWWYSGRFPSLEEGYPGPALFPRFVSIGFIISGLVLIWEIVAKAKADSGGEAQWLATRSSWLRLLGGIGLVVSYPFLQPLIGFVATLGLICFFMAILLKAKIWTAALTAATTVLLIYLAFSNLLGVAL